MLRREDGQTAVEYAGILAIIATIVVALAMLGLGDTVANAVKDAACVITGCDKGAGGGKKPAVSRSPSGSGAVPAGGNASLVSDAAGSAPRDPGDASGGWMPTRSTPAQHLGRHERSLRDHARRRLG